MPELSDIFRLANLAVGVIMVLAGIAKIIHHDHGLFEEIIVGAYIILFGACTALLEFQIPPYVSRYASFYFSFLGRGAFYLFIGSISLDNWWAGYVTGAIVMFVGAAYIAIEFMPQIEPPANMRSDMDAGWGAEQV